MRAPNHPTVASNVPFSVRFVVHPSFGVDMYGMHAPLPMSELRNPSHVARWIAPPPSSGPSGAPPYRPSREGAVGDPAYELHCTELCTVYVILHFGGHCCRAPGSVRSSVRCTAALAPSFHDVMRAAPLWSLRVRSGGGSHDVWYRQG